MSSWKWWLGTFLETIWPRWLISSRPRKIMTMLSGKKANSSLEVGKQTCMATLSSPGLIVTSRITTSASLKRQLTQTRHLTRLAALTRALNLKKSAAVAKNAMLARKFTKILKLKPWMLKIFRMVDWRRNELNKIIVSRNSAKLSKSGVPTPRCRACVSRALRSCTATKSMTKKLG